MTTVIINKETGCVISDSRATICNSTFSITKGFKRIFSTRYADDTQKIFKVGNVVVTGCGDLALVHSIRDIITKGERLLPKHYILRCEHGLSGANTYIVKRVLGEVHILHLTLNPTSILGSKYHLIKISKKVRKTSLSDGSGWAFAAGALSCGATMDKALYVAKNNDIYTGGITQRAFV